MFLLRNRIKFLHGKSLKLSQKGTQLVMFRVKQKIEYEMLKSRKHSKLKNDEIDEVYEIDES